MVFELSGDAVVGHVGDLFDHLSCQDMVSFTGSTNVGKHLMRLCADSMTRVTGSLVAGIQSAFAANWVYCCGEVIAGPRFYPMDGPGPGPGVAKCRRMSHQKKEP